MYVNVMYVMYVCMFPSCTLIFYSFEKRDLAIRFTIYMVHV